MPVEPSARADLRLLRPLTLPVAVLTVAALGAAPSHAGTVTDPLAPLSTYREVADGALPPWERPPVRSIVTLPGGASVSLRSGPGGREVARVASRTEFGTQTSMGVVRRRGRWLGVSTAARPNGKLGWVDARGAAVRRDRTRLAIHVDLSARRLELQRDGEVLRRSTVSVGRPGSTTPTGRFAVTDKLRGDRFGSYYGCCVLALSGTQPNLPPGWPGGNRLAIHGTPNPASLGGAISAGCVHASAAALELMIRRVPVGTPVFIRA